MSHKVPLTSANVGTAGSGGTAVEYGSGNTHFTVLTGSSVSRVVTLGGLQAITGILYTFPAGLILLKHVVCQGQITGLTSFPTTVTHGLGTVAANDAMGLSGTEVDLMSPAVTLLTSDPFVLDDRFEGPLTIATQRFVSAGTTVNFNMVPAPSWPANGTITFEGDQVILVWDYVGAYI